MSGPGMEDAVAHRVDWRLWLRVYRHALPYWRMLIPLVLAALGIAAGDASFGLVTRWAVDAVHGDPAGTSLLPFAAVYFGITALFAYGVWLFIRMAGGLSHRMSHDIRRDSFAKLQQLEFAYFDHRPVGWMTSRLTSDCDKLSRIIAWGTLDLLWATSLVLVISGVLLWLDWRLGLLVIGTIPLLVWLSAWFQKRLLLSARETRRFNSLITAHVTESLHALRTTRTFGREADTRSEFSALTTGMFDASMRNALQSAVYLPLVLAIGSVAAGLVLWRGGIGVASGVTSPGTLVAFIFYAGQFFNPINQIAMVLVQLMGAQAAGERVMELLATQPTIRDKPAVTARIAATQAAGGPPPGAAVDGLPAAINSVTFENVAFSYLSGQPVIHDFNLAVRRGQMVALVGASGGGKSTLVNLLARFYEPTAGRILIDGIDYRERSLAWIQSNLGIVLQTPHLFSGSIADNIRYGRLSASDADIAEAARRVNAAPFIEQLELGYATPVGEGGNRLSTGQKQLLSFARALLADPALFIMDEATSSIDSETEKWIQTGLATIFRDRISFVIAHRLSTIRAADVILVIDQGRVIEQGNHAALIAKKGHYHALLTKQAASREVV
jgi:ATP-binding cassette, subfamily B, bacterial